MDEIQLERRIAAQYKRAKILNEKTINGHQDFTFHTSDDCFEVWFDGSLKAQPWAVARIIAYGDGSDDNRYANYSYHPTLTNAFEWLSAFD